MASQSEKQVEIDFVREKFDQSTAAVLLDFRGVDVASVTELRSQLRAAGVEYRVVKNTLVKRALAGSAHESEALNAHLKGPTGIAWSFEDPSAAAKVIKKFREGDDGEKLTIKCGVLDNAVMPAEEVESVLASMPGKNELRAQLLATLQAPAQQLVRLLQAASQNFTYLLDARQRQLEEDS